MDKLKIAICLFLIIGIVSGCTSDDAKGGPVKYGECGDNICDNGENTETYPYYCPQDCQENVTLGKATG